MVASSTIKYLGSLVSAPGPLKAGDSRVLFSDLLASNLLLYSFSPQPLLMTLNCCLDDSDRLGHLL